MDNIILLIINFVVEGVSSYKKRSKEKAVEGFIKVLINKGGYK